MARPKPKIVRKLWEHLPTREDQAVAIQDIAKRLDLPPETVKAYIRRWARKGVLGEVTQARGGRVVKRYWRRQEAYTSVHTSAMERPVEGFVRYRVPEIKVVVVGATKFLPPYLEPEGKGPVVAVLDEQSDPERVANALRNLASEVERSGQLSVRLPNAYTTTVQPETIMRWHLIHGVPEASGVPAIKEISDMLREYQARMDEQE